MSAVAPRYGRSRRDYLTVAMDYALGCAGTCPSCVLSRADRAATSPATSVASIERAMAALAPCYGPIGTLALGIGRANVLALDPSHYGDLPAICRAAKRSFDFSQGAAEVSTSLVGKVDAHVDRARRVVDLVGPTGFDARFVVVANSALASPKYWENLSRFLRSLEGSRGGPDEDGAGDILQLTLSSDSLPDARALVSLVQGYRFPVNLAWSPWYDSGAADESALAALGEWLAEFYGLAAAKGLDSSLNVRTDQVMGTTMEGARDYAAYLRDAVGSIAYVATDGTWHEGFFTILAEMDPVRFDPLSEASHDGARRVVGRPAKELSSVLSNPACAECPHVARCVAGGTYRLAVMTLRRHPRGTSVCPSGMRATFDLAARALEAPDATRPMEGRA